MRRALVPVLLSIPIALLACGGGGGSPASKAWTLPASLDAHVSADGPEAWYPRAAMDGHGNAIVVWIQKDGAGDSQVFMSERRGGKWKHPAGLADHISLAGQGAGFPSVAMGDNGDAIVVWSQSNGVDSKIYKSEYRNGAWKHPAAFSDCIDVAGGVNAQEPTVAMDDQGNAIVVWGLSDAGEFHFYKAEYRSGAWTLPADLDDHVEPSGAEIANTAPVAMDNAGNAVITWIQDVASSFRIYKSDYRGGAWLHPVNLDDAISPIGNNAYNPVVVMNDLGEAIIAWAQYVNNNDAKIFKSEYRAGKWTHPADIADSISLGKHGVSVQAAMDAGGNAVLAWVDSNGTSNGVYKAVYRGGSWTFPSDLADRISPEGGSAMDPSVAMDDTGNALIAWVEGDGTSVHVFRSEYRGGAWVHPSSVSDFVSVAGSDVDDLLPALAMSADGTALIAWSQKDPATGQIYIGEYR